MRIILFNILMKKVLRLTFRHRWSGMDPTDTTCAARSYFILQSHAEIDIICHRGWSWKIRSTLYGFAGSFPRPLPRRNYRKGDSRGRAPYAVPRAETCYDNSVYQYEDTNPTAMNNQSVCPFKEGPRLIIHGCSLPGNCNLFPSLPTAHLRTVTPSR